MRRTVQWVSVLVLMVSLGAPMVHAQESDTMAHVGQALAAGEFEKAEQLLRAKRDQALVKAARYAHLAGMTAEMLLEYQRAVDYFTEAVQWDPSEPVYREHLSKAQQKVPGSKP